MPAYGYNISIDANESHQMHSDNKFRVAGNDIVFFSSV